MLGLEKKGEEVLGEGSWDGAGRGWVYKFFGSLAPPCLASSIGLCGYGNFYIIMGQGWDKVDPSRTRPVAILIKDNSLNEETRRKEKSESSSGVLVYKKQENQKGIGEVKVEIIMVLEEDPNPEKISNVITATRLAT